MLDDAYIVRRDNLGAVAPVSLVAVIFLGIMRGRDVHAALASEFTDCEREFGSRTETVEEVYMDIVGREYIGNNFGKFAGVVTHVMADCNAYLRQVFETFMQIICKALSGCGNCIDIHAV